MSSVLVFGASGAVGGFLLPQLRVHYKVIPASRVPHQGWVTGDLNDTRATWPAADMVVSLGPLDAFSDWLRRRSTTPQRVIALSSMSADSKRTSADPAERALAERLRDAEASVFEIGRQRGIACTIFRPTLIYGAGIDRSLAPIARFARRWHVLPMPLNATGLRQPVHAADLAAACIAALEQPATFGRIYPLGGGERLSFGRMLWRIRAALPGPVLPLPLPLFAFRLRRNVAAAALARLREPLIADNTDALRDFGYAPVAFRAQDVLPVRVVV
jgi:nucleoside-diphosphate-sugar epimerase